MNTNLSENSKPKNEIAPNSTWLKFIDKCRNNESLPFDVQIKTYYEIFGENNINDQTPQIWLPGDYEKEYSNIAQFMKLKGFNDYSEFHKWSIEDRDKFWDSARNQIGFNFTKQPSEILNTSKGLHNSIWFPHAELNCVDNCFNAGDNDLAIVAGDENSAALETTTYGELKLLVNRFSNGLLENGFVTEDRIALYLPMTTECVIAYLGIIKAGCQVVSIADSFPSAEIEKRMKISNAKAIVTVDKYKRNGKNIDLYKKVKELNIGFAIVINSESKNKNNKNDLRSGDIYWSDFLSDNNSFKSVICNAQSHTNILFSSGTTGTPKAIPWNHLTPLKCASDGYFHQDIHSEDVVAWPTNIGWMMGPWLIYASLINKATIALYRGSSVEEGFINFTKNSNVSILGLIPSLVRKWKKTGLLKTGDLKNIRLFSSTGEPSNFEDYFWLMSLTKFKTPIIEYMGGTEIGGGYLTGSVVQPASPSTFSTPALGIDFMVLNENYEKVNEGENGEVFLIPPSIGLSQELLNKDHFEVYYKDCPIDSNGNYLRRHGDKIILLKCNYYQAQGRSDDTMNVGGIKISSVEIEKVVNTHNSVNECAAISIKRGTGSVEKLIVFVVLNNEISREDLFIDLKSMISKRLNPLFKIYDLVITENLPKTASNKIVRRKLRNLYR